ncbi:hypothetical protein VE01_03601 [Pseudogymnoascus verrucosus]|uniref:RTA1 like protein n=1 Tax=Pseudogymnoascus verrucosus TaxID=342668 RepID=A0A1B8GS15_9PEZI|nr:uncharacterized protein VE01_03601 [Pseudogymnoascus verrucosus]OBT98627.1 hypothetical protein VE01_03601 [Pseudogymnoascus verrucosus]
MTELKSHNGYYLWHYLPSTPAAVIFCILFIIATVAHLWRLCKTRAWFCLAFTIGAFFEVIGFGARAAAHNRTDALMPYIIQNLFILLPPALFAASIYMTLGRIINAVNGGHLSIIRPTWLTKIFVGGDVFSFMVQGGGGGMMAGGDQSKVKLGQNMILGGLGIQLLMFGLFWLTAVLFHLKIRKNPTTESYTIDAKWEQYLGMLYMVSALIMIRSIFRVAEYVMGNDGYLLMNEWPLYVFDATLMFGVTVLFYWRHPGALTAAKIHDAERVQLESMSSKA